MLTIMAVRWGLVGLIGLRAGEHAVLCCCGLCCGWVVRDSGGSTLQSPAIIDEGAWQELRCNSDWQHESACARFSNVSARQPEVWKHCGAI